ncbi:MAG: glycosyltransferase family 2 protein [Rugosibacter sp.]|nr:glycosyltransferase family 2 protein [Rugosibacter sp.]
MPAELFRGIQGTSHADEGTKMISIVIPLYNKASTIERTVASVLAQTVSDWELIVIDDGSSDNGPALVNRFDDPRIRLVTQANAGVSAARNHGVELAVSTVVAFVDADDYWDAEHLANLGQLVNQFSGASIFSSAYFMVDEKGQIRKTCLSDKNKDSETMTMPNYFSDALRGDPPIHSSAVAVNKLAFSHVGGFPLGVKAGEDLITWARLACVGDVAYSRRATAYFVVPPISVNRNRSVIRRPQKPDYVGNELAGLSLQYNQYGASLRLYRGHWHRMRAVLFMELDERVDCLVELGKAIHISGLRLRDVANFGLLLFPAGARAKLLSCWRQRHVVSANTTQ